MFNASTLIAEGIDAEFESADLGDPRRKRRLKLIGSAIMTQPDVGFPQMVDGDSELEAFYRFFSNDHVDPDQVLASHVRATVARMRRASQPVLVLHDTTVFSFGGSHRRRGLGRTNGQQQGFLAHTALAVLPGEARLALGVCGMVRICRSEEAANEKDAANESKASGASSRESYRWQQLVEDVHGVTDGVDVVHVMDREGDQYDLLAKMQELGAQFIVRASHDRTLVEGGQLSDVETAPSVVQRDVAVAERPEDPNRRPKKNGKLKHPRRQQRLANLLISGATVSMRRPRGADSKAKSLTVNVVLVREQNPPAGEEPLSWTLYTTQPISTPKQLLAVVDNYRSRWVIEELFKALKTGCSIEKRQLESYHALTVALAVFIPIAWRLLLMRSVARATPDAPATTILTTTELTLIKHKQNAAPATAEEAFYAVAKLGGHLKRNGAPGWITLARGFERLLLMEAGWRAALQATSDESKRPLE